LQIDATDLLPARATAGLDGQTSRSRRCRKDCATAFLTNGVTSFFVELTSYIQVHTKCQYVRREENRSGVDQELRYGFAGIDISSEWARWTRQRLEDWEDVWLVRTAQYRPGPSAKSCSAGLSRRKGWEWKSTLLAPSRLFARATCRNLFKRIQTCGGAGERAGNHPRNGAHEVPAWRGCRRRLQFGDASVGVRHVSLEPP
jgi:hypothetical protein